MSLTEKSVTSFFLISQLYQNKSEINTIKTKTNLIYGEFNFQD